MSTSPRPDLSVVLPAYQLGRVIAHNIATVATALGSLGTVEIIVVDDGSTDDTYFEARRAAADLPFVRVIRHEVNRGKKEALFTGSKVTTADLVLFLDADLDLPAEQVPDLIARMGDADLLVGAKRGAMGEGRYPWPRRVLSRIFAIGTVGLFRLPIRETQTGLKLLTRPVVEEILPQVRIRGYAYDLEMLVRAHRAGFHLMELPVELGPSASSAPLRAAMLGQMGRDTMRLLWWTATGRIPPRRRKRPGDHPT